MDKKKDININYHKKTKNKNKNVKDDLKLHMYK